MVIEAKRKKKWIRLHALVNTLSVALHRRCNMDRKINAELARLSLNDFFLLLWNYYYVYYCIMHYVTLVCFGCRETFERK